MDTLENMELLGAPVFESADFMSMLLRFAINLAAIWLLVHFQYYSKSKRGDYYFTFMLISISVFFLIFLLGGVKIRIGFALGLFAIFGIIRYRTESMPVREMTYLFVIIAMSVINALSANITYTDIVVVNIIFLVATWMFESHLMMANVSTKLVQYDRIELIKPDRRKELIADLEERTGLNIQKVEIGGIDFLRDMAVIKVFYLPAGGDTSSVEDHVKISQEEWRNLP